MYLSLSQRIQFVFIIAAYTIHFYYYGVHMFLLPRCIHLFVQYCGVGCLRLVVRRIQLCCIIVAQTFLFLSSRCMQCRVNIAAYTPVFIIGVYTFLFYVCVVDILFVVLRRIWLWWYHHGVYTSLIPARSIQCIVNFAAQPFRLYYCGVDISCVLSRCKPVCCNIVVYILLFLSLRLIHVFVMITMYTRILCYIGVYTAVIVLSRIRHNDNKVCMTQ